MLERGTSTPRRCASCDATTLHDSSDLSEEFETSLCRSAKREGDLEPSSMPSLHRRARLLSTDPRETGCFPSEFLSILECLRVYSDVVYASSSSFCPGPNLNSFFAIRERILPSGFYLISLLNEISIRRLLETGVQFSRSPFPELR